MLIKSINIPKLAFQQAQTIIESMLEEKEERCASRGSGTYRPQQIVEEVMQLEESSVRRNKQMDISSEFITQIAKNLPLFFSKSEMTSQKLAEQLWKMQKSLQKNELHSMFSLSELERLYTRDWRYLSQPQKESLIANYIQNPYDLQQQITRVQRQIEGQGQIQ